MFAVACVGFSVYIGCSWMYQPFMAGVTMWQQRRRADACVRFGMCLSVVGAFMLVPAMALSV